MRIGIVNDVSLTREVLRRVVLSVPGYSIAWLAEDGAEAVRRTSHDRPDVVLMDLIMPIMDGVEATRRIMAANPCPILLVTASVSSNFPLVCEAMSFGGLDAVNTPTLGGDGRIHGGEGLLARIGRVDRSRFGASLCASPSVALSSPIKRSEPVCWTGERSGIKGTFQPDPLAPPMLALGASTGGPEALARILQSLPSRFPGAVVVIEHIAAEFAPNLVVWLQRRCALPVEIASTGQQPRAGRVAVAATDDHLVLRADKQFSHTREPIDYPFRPSVNAFFASAATHWPAPGVGVLLTGMGADGAQGLAALRHAGWLTIAQDEATSVVYGMPRAAVEMHAASRIMPLSQIPAAILARFPAMRRAGEG